MTDTQVQLYSPEFFADPYDYYGRLRETDPVSWDEQHEMWILTRYDDVKRVARQPHIYSSRLAALDTRPATPPVRDADLELQRLVDDVHRVEFIQLDPPDHTVKRAALSERFSPRNLEAVRPMVRQVIAELLDAVADQPGADLRAAVGKPLPLLVICRLMGIPEADVQTVAEQATARMANVLSLADDRMHTAWGGFTATADYLTATMDQRQAGGCPVGDDVLGDMVSAERSGTWSRAETLANAMMLVDAGHETTIQLICNGTLQLLSRPDQWDLLKADPRGLAASATDECLRLDPPLHALRRVVVEDVEVGGRTLRAGDRVVAVVASANRDPRRFPDPERFDITRAPNTHLSFGIGAHYCIGQYLARMEGQEYFAALAERFPRARMSPDSPLSYEPVPRVRSMRSLPVLWD
ncbi:MAG TPA: cytochrome P450 [Mycobacteriales bacterium]|nr:cytochrome P450 [Mycobacteriales bacterium]